MIEHSFQNVKHSGKYAEKNPESTKKSPLFYTIYVYFAFEALNYRVQAA